MNRLRQDIAITEATTFDGGNNRFMNVVNPDLHEITLGAGSYHGFKQNGVQIDPDNPPANITILKPEGWRDRFSSPGHTQTFTKRLSEYDKIYSILIERGGEDAISAWVILVDAIHAGTADMSWDTFKTDFKAASVGNLSEVTALVDALKPALPDGWGWSDVRDWVNSEPRELLVGDEVEVVEVVS